MIKIIYPKSTDLIEVSGVTFTHADLQSVVQDFYAQIPSDILLEVPFRNVEDWPEHINRLTHFWWIRFGGKPYLAAQYDPVAKHFPAGFNSELLARWLSLFGATMRKHLSAEQQTAWITIAERMGQSLSARNEILRRDFESRRL